MSTRLPRYPIYIISKGRWGKNALTAKALDRLGVPYKIVVEPHEVEKYAETIPRDRILVLPFQDLGLGSIPARNWVWDHAKASGAPRHWILDDNIKRFMRLHNNNIDLVTSPAMFVAAEDFVDRYENVAMAGFQYTMFAFRYCRAKYPPGPFRRNARVYSCILLDNNLPDDLRQWRGRYNEDTDLSLRILKARYCTILFNAFTCDKMATMRMKGGNTDKLYAKNGRRTMAEALVAAHPDVTHIVHKWGRWQHQVDYSPFRGNKLRLKPGVVIPDGPDEYGMVLKRIK